MIFQIETISKTNLAKILLQWPNDSVELCHEDYLHGSPCGSDDAVTDFRLYGNHHRSEKNK